MSTPVRVFAPSTARALKFNIEYLAIARRGAKGFRLFACCCRIQNCCKHTLNGSNASRVLVSAACDDSNGSGYKCARAAKRHATQSEWKELLDNSARLLITYVCLLLCCRGFTNALNQRDGKRSKEVQKLVVEY